MDRLECASLILSLAESLKANGSWTGETHVQKAGYFLQELLGVPSSLEYILYKHGPFSFELRDLLTYMQAEDFIRWVPQPPYGPTLRSGELAEELKDQFGELSKQYDPQIKFVAEQLGRKTVADLERIATALYVTKEEHRSGSERINRIVALKPHITTDQAEAAVNELDQITTTAEKKHLAIH